MPCEILIVAVAKAGLTQRGYPWIIKDTPAIWGSKEGLPNWVILRIANATKVQVEQYLQSWYKKFVYDILVDNAQGYRIRVKVDPLLVSASGVNKTIKSELKNMIVNDYSAAIVSYDDFEAIVDIPKPVDLQAVKNDVHDLFNERIDTRFYYFTEVDVALAEANGGVIQLTKKQVLNRIKSKLDE